MTIKRIETQQLKQVALLHIKIFPDYFLTNVGLKVLTKYYGVFLDDKENIFFGAFTPQNELIGFALVTPNYSESIDRFYRKYGILLATQIIKNIFKCNPVILGGLKARICRFFLKNNNSSSGEKKPSLLSIGVDPSFTGKGVASGLINSVEEILKTQNTPVYGLSVKKENMRAKRFYEKMGFSKTGETTDLEYYSRHKFSLQYKHFNYSLTC